MKKPKSVDVATSPAEAAATLGKQNPVRANQQVTLRAPRQLVARYVDRAAERSKELGRTVSTQQIMLEVLEQGAEDVEKNGDLKG